MVSCGATKHKTISMAGARPPARETISDSWCMFANNGGIGGCWSARETAPTMGGRWSATQTNHGHGWLMAASVVNEQVM